MVGKCTAMMVALRFFFEIRAPGVCVCGGGGGRGGGGDLVVPLIPGKAGDGVLFCLSID